MNELVSTLIEFAAETGEEASKNVIKDFLSSKEFILGTSIVVSTVISNEIDTAINRKMDEDNMPERMSKEELKNYNLKKKLTNAIVDGTTKGLVKSSLTALAKAATKTAAKII